MHLHYFSYKQEDFKGRISRMENDVRRWYRAHKLWLRDNDKEVEKEEDGEEDEDVVEGEEEEEEELES